VYVYVSGGWGGCGGWGVGGGVGGWGMTTGGGNRESRGLLAKENMST
jgi:hypothetical protein